MFLIWRSVVLLADFEFFPVVFAALYWKRTNKEGAIASVLAALFSWLYYFHESGYGGEYMVGPGIVPAAICFGASAFSIGIGLLFHHSSFEGNNRKIFSKVTRIVNS